MQSVSAAAQDPWTISASQPHKSEYYGITVANGMLGLISSAQPMKNSEVVLAGAYDTYARGGVSNFFKGIDFLNVSLSIDGKSVNQNSVEAYEQQLDMRKATFGGNCVMPGKAKITYKQYALRQLPYCGLMVIDVEPLADITLVLYNNHAVPDALRDAHFRYNEIHRRHASVRFLSTDAKSPTGKLSLTATSAILLPGGEETAVEHRIPDSNRHYTKMTKALRKGETYRLAVVGAMLADVHHPDPKNEADRLTVYAALEGVDRLVARHESAWEYLWQSDITIEGDAQAQQDVHSMLYHLYSFVREGSSLSLSPMGLSGLGYNGHVFWDADIWMFPPLLVLHPEMARSMVDYRFNRLEAARKNAAEHGYRGAMFPWESSDSGFEETPVWALSGTFEHHITACVAWAAWQYYCVSGDMEWLRAKGYPLICETADFWVSRIERDPQGKAHIYNVVCADEWAENVDDNAFTNAAAMTNLRIAVEAAHLLGVEAKTEWKELSQALPVLQMEDGVTREHATYQGENIKQADVNLLAYPLKYITNPAQIAKDLSYYEQRVPQKNTPAMTQAIFALLYSRLGNAEQAAHYFSDAYVPNLCPPFRVIAECKGGSNPYFATGAGGVLQSVLMGFAGIDITDKGIKLVKSVLPKGWTRLTITGVGREKKTVTLSAPGK